MDLSRWNRDLKPEFNEQECVQKQYSLFNNEVVKQAPIAVKYVDKYKYGHGIPHFKGDKRDDEFFVFSGEHPLYSGLLNCHTKGQKNPKDRSLNSLFGEDKKRMDTNVISRKRKLSSIKEVELPNFHIGNIQY